VRHALHLFPCRDSLRRFNAVCNEYSVSVMQTTRDNCSSASTYNVAGFQGGGSSDYELLSCDLPSCEQLLTFRRNIPPLPFHLHREQGTQKRRYSPTELHGFTDQKGLKYETLGRLCSAVTIILSEPNNVAAKAITISIFSF
jgi:hypothetical protein